MLFLPRRERFPGFVCLARSCARRAGAFAIHCFSEGFASGHERCQGGFTRDAWWTYAFRVLRHVASHVVRRPRRRGVHASTCAGTPVTARRIMR